MATLRVSEFLPPKFDGSKLDDTEAHLLSFEDYCTIQNVKPDDKTKRFLTTLSGQARLWVENFKSTGWDDLKSKFSNRFSDVQTREAALGAFRTCTHKSGESVDTYLSRLRRLADRLKYADDTMILDQFLNGLPADAKVSVMMARPIDLEDAAQLAQQYLDLQKTSIKEVSFECQDLFRETLDTLAGEVASLKLDRDNKFIEAEERRDRNKVRESKNRSRDNSGSRTRFEGMNDRRRSRERSSERYRYRDYTPERRNSEFTRGRARNRGRGRSRFSDSRSRGRCFYCDSPLHRYRECPQRMQDDLYRGQRFNPGINQTGRQSQSYPYTYMQPPAPQNAGQFTQNAASQQHF